MEDKLWLYRGLVMPVLGYEGPKLDKALLSVAVKAPALQAAAMKVPRLMTQQCLAEKATGTIEEVLDTPPQSSPEEVRMFREAIKSGLGYYLRELREV